MEKFKRKKLELKYSTDIFEVYKDYLELPDGRQVVYDYVNHREGVGVLPVTEDGRLILVRQYRNSLDDITVEIPAGLVDCGETPFAAAKRELKEETGYETENMTFVSKISLAIGTSNEQTSVFIAEHVKAGEAAPDENEFIEIFDCSLLDAEEMIKSGEIRDSKTLVAILYYKCMVSGV
jgi:ADP-ribose pyrophosphatase